MRKSFELDLNDAELIAVVALEKAKKENLSVVIAITDAGGHLIFLKKMDGTQIRSIDIAIHKARTAVFYKRSTKIFEDAVRDGNRNMLALPDILPFEGGLPIFYKNQVFGAIGVSGATPTQDGMIAEAGLRSFVFPETD